MNKKIATIIAFSLVIMLIFMPLYRGFDIMQPPPVVEKIFIELWHVDGYQGGKNSRADFLEKRAVDFNKIHKDYFIIVKNMTKDEMLSRLERGEKCDILSYGTGVGNEFLPYIKPYSGAIYVTDNMLSAVTYNNDIMGLPWCCGGYFLVGADINLFHYGSDLATSPLASLYASIDGEKLSTMNVKKSITTKDEAYVNYINNGGSLLCSQREIVKLNIAVERGLIDNYEVQPLNKYSDLVSVVSLVKGISTENEAVAMQFMQYLTTKEVQSKLINLMLFSVTGEKLYSVTGLSDYESGNNDVIMGCVYDDVESRERLNELVIGAIQGNEKYKNFLEKYLRIDNG